MSEIKNKITLASIVCIAQNHMIGKDNDMIWHLPEDLKHFKRTTLGKPIIMGRKSYESLGKPLPGRPNIVVSRSYKDLPDDQPTSIFKDMEAVEVADKPKINAGPYLYDSIEAGINAGYKMAEELGVDEVFITGGGEIYRQTLPDTERLYLTIIHQDYEGDTKFPEFDWNEWKIAHEDKREEGDLSYTFYTLDRR